jgi:hypothetical protein
MGKIEKKCFTLIELFVSISIFTVILLVLMNFLKTVHTASNISRGEKNVFENSRIALDLITRDIQCIYYGSDSAPFWHWKPTTPPAAWGTYRNELLAFVSATSLPPNEVCTSDLCEVKYQLYYATNPTDASAGWLRRSVTGNKLTNPTRDNVKWNFNNNYSSTPGPNFLVGFASGSGGGIPYASFTANSTSSEDYQKLIPYVTKFEITCYRRDGDDGEEDDDEPDDDRTINPDTQTSTAAINTDTQPSTLPDGMEFPYSVQINLSMLNKDSWQKWISIGGEPDNLRSSGPIYDFRRKYERTFTKTVLIGDRGQYDQ